MKDYKLVLKKIGCIIGTVLTISLMVLTTVICFSIKWMFDTWSNLTMDELVYHITAPLEGTNEGMIKEYLDFCIVPTVLVLIFVVILFYCISEAEKIFCNYGYRTCSFFFNRNIFCL